MVAVTWISMQLMWRPLVDRMLELPACSRSHARSPRHPHDPSSFGGVKDPRGIGILCCTWGKKERGGEKKGRARGLAYPTNKCPNACPAQTDRWVDRWYHIIVLRLHTLILLPASGPRCHMHANNEVVALFVPSRQSAWPHAALWYTLVNVPVCLAEIWLMLLLMLICRERKTLFLH